MLHVLGNKYLGNLFGNLQEKGLGHSYAHSNEIVLQNYIVI
jgi:hypothetical protein